MPEDLKDFIALMTGERKPLDEREEAYLRMMGGVRGPVSQWEKKWTVCTQCGSEWQQTGLPASHGKWIYHPVCKSCRRDFAQTSAAKARQRHRKDIDD